MPPVPVLILCGAAGDGKDAAADAILEARPGSVKIAIADPMKRFCQQLFGFSDESLWGPSELRGVPDERYADPAAWRAAWKARTWISMCKELGVDTNGALDALERWFACLCKEHLDDPDLFYNSVTQAAEWFPRHSARPDRIVRVLTPRRALQTFGATWTKALKPNAWIDLALATAFRLLEGGCRYEPKTGLGDDATIPPANWVVISDGRLPREPVAVKRAGGAAVRMRNPTPRELTPGEHVSEMARLIPDNRFDGVLKNDRSHGLEALRGAAGEMMRELEVGYGQWKTWDHRREPSSRDAGQ